MSKGQPRARNLKFVDVTPPEKSPNWIDGKPQAATQVSNDNQIRTLHPPELGAPSAHRLAPLLESLRPAPVSIAPPPMQSLSEPAPAIPGPPPIPSFRKPDTLIEDLVPRAEEEAAQSILQAVEAYVAARHQQLAGAEEDLVALVRVISERVIGREIALDPNICRSLVQEGLTALGDTDKVWIRLGPFFADAVDELTFELEEKGISASVTVDPSIGLQGCQIETELGHVDESVESRIERLLGKLAPEAPSES